MKTMKETVAAQQKTLEDLQQDKRAKNLIITGVPEPEGAQTPVQARQSDQSTVDEILAAVECPGIAPCRVTRIGRKQDVRNDNQQPPPRPLLVSLSSVTDVRSVLIKSN